MGGVCCFNYYNKKSEGGHHGRHRKNSAEAQHVRFVPSDRMIEFSVEIEHSENPATQAQAKTKLRIIEQQFPRVHGRLIAVRGDNVQRVFIRKAGGGGGGDDCGKEEQRMLFYEFAPELDEFTWTNNDESNQLYIKLLNDFLSIHNLN